MLNWPVLDWQGGCQLATRQNILQYWQIILSGKRVNDACCKGISHCKTFPPRSNYNWLKLNQRKNLLLCSACSGSMSQVGKISKIYYCLACDNNGWVIKVVWQGTVKAGGLQTTLTNFRPDTKAISSGSKSRVIVLSQLLLSFYITLKMTEIDMKAHRA